MNARAIRFPLFDSLRAIAALSILGYHGLYFGFLHDRPHNLLIPLAASLNVGVVVFFAISGFLLYRPFVRARLRGEPLPAVGAYAWRRFLRIVPGYWVALTVVVLCLQVPGVLTKSGIPTYYGFLQIYGADTALGGIGQAWSLCVELTFYLLIPLWAFAMRRLPGTTREALAWGELVALAGLGLAGFAFQAWTLSELGPHFTAGGTWRLFSLPFYLDTFALGMALALLSAYWEERATPPGMGLLDRFPGIAWLGSALALWGASTLVGPDGQPAHPLTDTKYLILQQLLYTLCAVCLIVPAVFGDQGRGIVRRVLANRALLYVGLISYGVYLYHLAVLTQLTRWGLPHRATTDWLLWFAVGIAGSVLLASLSYYLIERPALSLKRFVGPRGVAPDQPGAVSAPVAPTPPAG